MVPSGFHQCEFNIFETWMERLNTLTDDLLQVKGSVGQLQRATQQLLQRIPPSDEYQKLVQLVNSTSEANLSTNDKFVFEKLKVLINSPSVKIGVKLKQLHDEDKLPFLQLLSRINLKSIPISTLNYILNFDKENASIQNEMETLTEMESRDIPDADPLQLPHLLPIKDEHLYKRVFHDKLFIDSIITVVNIERYGRHINARLIQQGRCYLRLILWEIINYKYISIFHEDHELLVEKLMDPNLLFKFSMVYKLSENLKYKLSDHITTANKILLISNLFLSYIGALACERPISDIQIWIYKIYQVILPKVKDTDIHFKPVELLVENMFKFVFSDFEYLFEQLETDPFVVKLHVKDYSVIGTNSHNEKMAQVNAMKELLNDKDAKIKLLFDKYVITKKKEVDLEENFNNLLLKHNISVTYETNSAGPVYHCAIKWNAVILGVGIDKDEATAVKKSQQSSYNNLSVLLQKET